VKYTTDGVSPGASSAFMPIPAQASTKAWRNGMIEVHGFSGNVAVTSPKPEALPNGPLMRSAQPSYNAPDIIRPSVYYVTITNLGPGSVGIRTQSTNEVPQPAGRENLLPQIAARRPIFGGLRQVTWPPAPMAWQSVASGGIS
jgi:hypothetical protein